MDFTFLNPTKGAFSKGSMYNNYQCSNVFNASSVFGSSIFASPLYFSGVTLNNGQTPNISNIYEPFFEIDSYQSEIEIESYSGLTVNYEMSFMMSFLFDFPG